MVDVKLPQELRVRIGRVDAGPQADRRHPAGGLRGRRAGAGRDVRDRGTTFKTKFDLVEAMGAEYYVHFGVKADALRQSSQMEDLLADQGGVSETDRRGRGRRRRAPERRGRVKVGEPTEVWLDATKLHFFDADSGESLVV